MPSPFSGRKALFGSPLLAPVLPFGLTCARVRLPYSQARAVSILVGPFLRFFSASSFDSASILRFPAPLDCCSLFPQGFPLLPALFFLCLRSGFTLLSASFFLQALPDRDFRFRLPFPFGSFRLSFLFALLPLSVSAWLPLSILLRFRFLTVAARLSRFLSAFFRPLLLCASASLAACFSVSAPSFDLASVSLPASLGFFSAFQLLFCLALRSQSSLCVPFRFRSDSSVHFPRFYASSFSVFRLPFLKLAQASAP